MTTYMTIPAYNTILFCVANVFSIVLVVDVVVMECVYSINEMCVVVLHI